jgi:membrane-associated phospholipid phosphatase
MKTLELSSLSPPPRTRRRALRQAAMLAAIMATSLGLYLVVLKWRGPDAALSTYTAWDDLFPFRPEWVWVYLVPYLLGPLQFALVTPATFDWYIRRGLVVVAISLLIFAALPTRTAPRPPAPDLGDGLTARMYRQMIAIDEPPANAAPSLHVSLTCLLALALMRDFPRWWAAAFGGVAVVWLATLLTRQHHLIDVATGALLAVAVVLAWPSPRRAPAVIEEGAAACLRQ